MPSSSRFLSDASESALRAYLSVPKPGQRGSRCRVGHAARGRGGKAAARDVPRPIPSPVAQGHRRRRADKSSGSAGIPAPRCRLPSNFLGMTLLCKALAAEPTPRERPAAGSCCLRTGGRRPATPPNIYESGAPVKSRLAQIKSLLSREAFWSCSFQPRLSNPIRSRPAPDAPHRTRDLRRDFAGNIYRSLREDGVRPLRGMISLQQGRPNQ